MRPHLERGGEDAHLVPCPHCGSINGINAAACWSCERALPPVAYDENVSARKPDAPVAKGASGARTESAGAGQVGAPNGPAGACVTPPTAPCADPHLAPGSATPLAVESAAQLAERFSAPADAAFRRARRRRRAAFAGAVALGIAITFVGYPLYRGPVPVRMSQADIRPANASTASRLNVPLLANEPIEPTPHIVRPSAMSAQKPVTRTPKPRAVTAAPSPPAAGHIGTRSQTSIERPTEYQVAASAETGAAQRGLAKTALETPAAPAEALGLATVRKAPESGAQTSAACTGTVLALGLCGPE